MLRAAVLFAIVTPCFCQAPIRGFSQEAWKGQHDLENKAIRIPQPERVRTYMERMSSVPHHAGSPASKAVAEYALGLFREWGLEARIETFDPMLPYPTTRILEMTAPVRFRAALKEPPLVEDKSTALPGQMPTFNAYSAAGDVTGPLLYVNYGLQEDYEYLRSQGIDVKGKIVIARYGKSWRGVKPKLAQENGALACILYSDPRDDGFFQGEIYPKGPMRPWQGVQRGSVIDMAVEPGDPLTPGWASDSNAKRITREESKVLPRIPVMPISYGDAKPLLEQLDGPVAPEDWRGALPLTYHVGPGPATVHLKVDFDWSNKPIYNVIGILRGSSEPEQWVVYGNHHDAWVMGASDPGGGAAALLETARALGRMRKSGWRPKRTIVFALWDAEEFGLIGSTEWVEKHLDELQQKSVAYINSDSNGKGGLGAGGSHTLEMFVGEVLRDLTDPRTSRSLLEIPRRPRRGSDLQGFHLDPLGAGSDYVAFLNHAGIASLNMGFGGLLSSGIYHSSYDTFRWYEQFSDVGFANGQMLAKIMSTALMRLSDAAVLPFEFSGLARTVRGYVDEIRHDADKAGLEVDLREVLNQTRRLETAARVYNEELIQAMNRPGSLPAKRLQPLNTLLAHAENALLLDGGLPGREWYRHQIYAPGLYTGYGAKTLPGVREAVESKRAEEANQQARRVAQVLRTMVSRVEEATRLIKRAGE